MKFAAILSIILFVITNHIWCGTVNPGDIETLKAIVIPYRHTKKEGTQVLLSYPEKSGHTKGHCFPGGKANQDDNGNNLATAIRELEEETGYKNARFSHQIFEWTQPDRRQDFDVMTFVYLAEIDEKEEPGEGKDMKSRRNEWVNIEDDIRSKLKIRHDSVKAWEKCGSSIPKVPKSSNSENKGEVEVKGTGLRFRMRSR